MTTIRRHCDERIPKIRHPRKVPAAPVRARSTAIEERNRPSLAAVEEHKMILYEVMCIAMAIYHEARGEPLAGRFAVAEVVMNRMADPRYPDDACSVVYDGGEGRHQCEFSFYCDGKSDQPDLSSIAWHSAQRVAQAVYEHRVDPIVGAATHYHTIYTRPDWASSGYVVATVNDHVFYRGIK